VMQITFDPADRLFRLIVPLKPVPWKRPADTRTRGKRTNPKAMKVWQGDVSYLAACEWRKKPIDYGVMLLSMSVIRRPKAMKKDPDVRIFRPTTPDGDNCQKNVADALEKGEVLTNDKLIVVTIEVDAYGRVGEEPKTILELHKPNPAFLLLLDAENNQW